MRIHFVMKKCIYVLMALRHKHACILVVYSTCFFVEYLIFIFDPHYKNRSA